MSNIKQVAVIGAGVMGSGIAAQIANAGFEVVLLDIVPEAEGNRNILAESALQKLQKNKPAAFMQAEFCRRITAGNLEDDLEKLSACDWIIEAVLERLDIKQALYHTLEAHRKTDSIVSSNTSTLPLGNLTAGLPESFRKDFLITHFFNPPRYMRLLELVVSQDTDPAQEARIREFADLHLGKSLVDCHDTPGFIANRIGTYWLHAAVSLAVKHNIGVEEADAVLGRPAGVPKTGVFGLIDLVGLDLMPHLFKSFEESLAADDEFRKLGPMPDLIGKLIKDGYTGRKGKGGFYRLHESAAEKTGQGGGNKPAAKVKEVIDLQSGTWSKAGRPKLRELKVAKKGGLQALFSHDSPLGHYAWQVISGTLSYAASLVPEIADNIEAVDRAMRLGYNWKKGPFELIDELGPEWFIERLEREGRAVPAILRLADGRKFYRSKAGSLQYLDVRGDYQQVQFPEGVLLLENIKRSSKPILRNSQASLWDIGDGVACLEFHSKMNSLNPLVMRLLAGALKKLPKLRFKGLVIYNEGSNFSVGANLLMLLVASRLHLNFAIRWILRQGQFTLKNMKYADFPIVGAPSGMALGGGCEVLLHCDAIVAHAESYIGLVETGVGIVPGWGGCKEMLLRAKASDRIKKGPMPAVSQTFETIAMAKVSSSAYEAKDLLFLREKDVIVMNRDRVLQTAKQRVLDMAQHYKAPEQASIKLPGETGVAALDLAVTALEKRGLVSAHDHTIARELARVLTGDGADLNDELTEDSILQLERNALVRLAATKKSKARISHMLMKGKALRN